MKLRDGILWAAGFLEGEGSFSSSRTTPAVTAVQVQESPLLRLKEIFGGTIRMLRVKNPKHSDHYRWEAGGSRAVGVMLTIYSLMSSKRRLQIDKSITRWKNAPGSNAHNRVKTHCPKGHPYSGENLVIQKTRGGRGQKRMCRICFRASQNKYVAKIRLLRKESA